MSEARSRMCLPLPPNARTSRPRRANGTAGGTPLIIKILKRKNPEQIVVCKGPLIANFVRELPDRQERGVEHTVGLVGPLALVLDLVLEVVPPTEFVSVLPAGCEL